MFFPLIACAGLAADQDSNLVLKGEAGPGKGVSVVLIAGDEEYRSEEGLPQLAKILSKRFGFDCRVSFSVNTAGEIDPDEHRRQTGLEALEKADLCIILLRFREWPDEQMAHFDRYVKSGKPILALRTSTHAFDYALESTSPYRRYGWRSQDWPGGFGKQILGENWVSHWGEHGRQSTRAFPVADHPVLRGVETVFVTTDVYEASPPQDAAILMRGHVLAGMDADSLPVTGRKTRADGNEVAINDPAMPVVWMRETPGKVVTCTMGAATDLLDQGLRRLLVNCSLYLTKGEKAIDPDSDVSLVGDYRPSAFGFGGYKKGVKPSDLVKKG